MKDIIKNQGWTSIVSNTGDTFFCATDRPFLRHTMTLEVIKGDSITSDRVLVNGEKFHEFVIPNVEEAKEFCNSLSGSASQL